VSSRFGERTASGGAMCTMLTRNELAGATLLEPDPGDFSTGVLRSRGEIVEMGHTSAAPKAPQRTQNFSNSRTFVSRVSGVSERCRPSGDAEGDDMDRV